jgi:hypothetical protein
MCEAFHTTVVVTAAEYAPVIMDALGGLRDEPTSNAFAHNFSAYDLVNTGMDVG